jgi:hypothetical protein
MTHAPLTRSRRVAVHAGGERRRVLRCTPCNLIYPRQLHANTYLIITTANVFTNGTPTALTQLCKTEALRALGDGGQELFLQHLCGRVHGEVQLQ